MKHAFGLALIGLSLTTSAVARDGDVLTRGSQAWFAVESGEHEIRALLASGALAADSLTGLSIDLTSPSTSDVLVDAVEGQITDSCRMVDHWSRHGTVLKKEVYCDVSPASEPRAAVARGTTAWALSEALEHSLRLAMTTNADVKESLSFIDADLVGEGRVEVKIGLLNGAELEFVCTLPSLNCSAL